MNLKLKEINEIIKWCDQMMDVVYKTGYIKSNHEYYRTYCKRINSFCTAYDLEDSNYAPYVILHMYWKPYSNATLYPSEIAEIRHNLILIKHDLLKDAYEKIFISHRERDADQVAAFIELLHVIGIPRTTVEDSESIIFCTSHPEGYIKNGERNLDKIRDMLNTDKHVFYILWYTDRYFDSPACLNEAGAIWAMKKKYQEILMPNFDEKKINGLLDKQPIWFKADNKARLNTFKEQIETMFELTPIALNVWEKARDTFIDQISKITGAKEEFREQ
jgi:hypothetical protein